MPAKENAPEAYIDNFPILLQNPALPSGCEVTALTMVLNYMGYQVSNDYLADYCLPYGGYGDNIFEKFIGSVYDDSSYGCYADAICRCAQAYSTEYQTANISGASLEDLCGFTAAGYPVIVWATESMRESGAGVLWEYNGMPMGYLTNEHCLVMIGYNKEKNTITLADPLEGEKEYEMTMFEHAYCSQYKQAVLLFQEEQH